jgi:hypothetical protein
VIAADLVSQTPRTGVDHDAELSGPQPERLGHRPVVDLVHRLHLEEVVAGSEAADLAEPALHGALADLSGSASSTAPESSQRSRSRYPPWPHSTA